MIETGGHTDRKQVDTVIETDRWTHCQETGRQVDTQARNR